MGNSTGEELFERIKAKAQERIEKRIGWGEELVAGMGGDKVPFPAQAFRVYEMVENGTKRIILADATGFGKTYVSSMILGLLNKKKGKRHKVLLMAPRQSLETAWKEDEINDYLNGLGINSGNPISVRNLQNGNLERGLEGTDILTINYEKFSCASSERYVGPILGMAKNLDLIILDEGQNAKGKKRSENIKKLVQETRDKRFIYLSATPAQNDLADLGMPFHILDPENYDGSPYDYDEDPDAIKMMILNKKLFISDRETVKALFKLPPLKIHEPVYCDIGQYYAKRYLKVWEDGNLSVMHKIAQMRKYLLLGKLNGKEGRADLTSLLEKFPKDDALITYSHHKTGISKELFEFLEYFYGKGQVAMINGDIKDITKRIEITERFKDGEFKVLANSLKTMGEGVPCTTGERRARLLFLEEPFNHGQLNQCIGRPYRPGQKEKVDVYFALGKNEWLQEKMIKIKESGILERKYDVSFPKEWRNTLIDFDIYEIMNWKDEIDKEKIRNALPLSEVEKIIMSLNQDNKKSINKASRIGIFRSLPIKNKKIFVGNKMKEFTLKGHKLYWAGERELYNSSCGNGIFNEESKIMLEAHREKRILDTAAGDTARLMKRIIESTEEKQGYLFKNPLDVGCGTGVVSRVLVREMTNLDLDRRMLAECRKYGLGLCKHGFMTRLPFKDKQFDLVTASYSLFYLCQNEGKRELEEALLEINRVSKENALFIASLNRKTSKKDFETIAHMMPYYEFRPIIKDFFTGYSDNGKRSKFQGTYIITSVKDGDTDSWAVVDGGFNIYGGGYHITGRGGKKNFKEALTEGQSKAYKAHKIYSDEFKNERGTSLTSILKRIKLGF